MKENKNQLIADAVLKFNALPLSRKTLALMCVSAYEEGRLSGIAEEKERLSEKQKAEKR